MASVDTDRPPRALRGQGNRAGRGRPAVRRGLDVELVVGVGELELDGLDLAELEGGDLRLVRPRLRARRRGARFVSEAGPVRAWRSRTGADGDQLRLRPFGQVQRTSGVGLGEDRPQRLLGGTLRPEAAHAAPAGQVDAHALEAPGRIGQQRLRLLQLVE